MITVQNCSKWPCKPASSQKNRHNCGVVWKHGQRNLSRLKIVKEPKWLGQEAEMKPIVFTECQTTLLLPGTQEHPD